MSDMVCIDQSCVIAHPILVMIRGTTLERTDCSNAMCGSRAVDECLLAARSSNNATWVVTLLVS
jgi:hypothetical protein